MSSGKRAADRKTWPWRDRVRFQIYRLGRLGYVVVPIVLVAYIVVTDGNNTDRDEARKYQRCTQAVTVALAQNATNRALSAALQSSATQRRQQALRTKDPAVLIGLLVNASDLESSRNSITFASVPDCRRTYPRGFEHSDDYPDLAPAAPPR
jgi:hypothetical protein